MATEGQIPDGLKDDIPDSVHQQQQQEWAGIIQSSTQYSNTTHASIDFTPHTTTDFTQIRSPLAPFHVAPVSSNNQPDISYTVSQSSTTYTEMETVQNSSQNNSYQEMLNQPISQIQHQVPYSGILNCNTHAPVQVSYSEIMTVPIVQSSAASSGISTGTSSSRLETISFSDPENVESFSTEIMNIQHDYPGEVAEKSKIILDFPSKFNENLNGSAYLESKEFHSPHTGYLDSKTGAISSEPYQGQIPEKQTEVLVNPKNETKDSSETDITKTVPQKNVKSSGMKKTTMIHEFSLSDSEDSSNHRKRLRNRNKKVTKRSKRIRKKKMEEPVVEFEIVNQEDESELPLESPSHDLNSSDGDLLQELNSIKEDYDKLKVYLDEVETKYNELLTGASPSKKVNDKENHERFAAKLQSVVAELFNKQIYSDVLIILEEGHHLYGHKLILSARSEIWAPQNLYHVDRLDLSGLRHEVAYEVMKWVYTDELETKVDHSFLIEILHASIKYKLDSLFTRCEKALISHININNCEHLKDVAEQCVCLELQVQCQRFLDMHHIAPVSPLEEDTVEDEEPIVNINQCIQCDEAFITMEELAKHSKKHEKRETKKSVKSLKEKHRRREKKKISEIVDKLHKSANDKTKTPSEKIASKLQRMQMKARIIAGEKPYQCEQCGRAFAAKGNLKRHISMHSDDKPFVCEICGKGFKTKSEVKRHDIVHSGEKRFMCDICSMCFSAGSSLQRHMRIHRGEKPYQCDACGKSFRSSGDVTKHNLVHTGEKPYKCPICGKPFSRTQHVKKHMGIHRRQLQYQNQQFPDYIKVDSSS